MGALGWAAVGATLGLGVEQGLAGLGSAVGSSWGSVVLRLRLD